MSPRLDTDLESLRDRLERGWRRTKIHVVVGPLPHYGLDEAVFFFSLPELALNFAMTSIEYHQHVTYVDPIKGETTRIYKEGMDDGR